MGFLWCLDRAWREGVYEGEGAEGDQQTASGQLEIFAPVAHSWPVAPRFASPFLPHSLSHPFPLFLLPLSLSLPLLFFHSFVFFSPSLLVFLRTFFTCRPRLCSAKLP